MYVNVNMIPVETVPGTRGGEMGERSGGEGNSMLQCTYIQHNNKINTYYIVCNKYIQLFSKFLKI
jgi:hypothetical protein